MATSVVGRDAELASILDFVAHMSREAAALVLEGDAGMGKTTLWRAAIALAEERGVLVLQAQPVESETTLSFAGVGDLLDPVLDSVLEPLPAAQRRALERALVLGEDEETPLDPRSVRVALMNALRLLADAQPVLVAIDDSQWLDYASSAGLAYGIRRFRAERFGLLLSRRYGLESVLLNELLRSPVGERFTRVSVGPLDVVALHRLLQQRLGVILPRPLLAEVGEASGGNPFYAIEIVRTLQRRGSGVEAGQPLPVPDSLHDLLDERLGALPSDCRDFLLAAASHAHPTIAITEAATQVGVDAGLGPALDAGIVELDGSRIRFTHPLLAACAYESADPRRRAAIHGRLSELLEDPEARAWQLAAATGEPDEEVASVLEAAAQHARERGAPRPAALLLDRARELTPGDRPTDGVRRAIDAAFLHFESGDSPRAKTQLAAVEAGLPPGSARARALVVLARIRLYERPDEAFALFLRVIDEVGDDLPTLALAHEGVAACGVWMFERFDDALGHSDLALELAAQLGDDALVADALMSQLTCETVLGRPEAAATAERALALQTATEELRILDQPLVSLAEGWIWVDQQRRARDALTDLLRRAQLLGDENGRPWLLCLLGESERTLGHLETALECARDAWEAADQAGLPLFSGLGRGLESHVLAQLGHADAAEDAAQRAAECCPDGYTRLLTATALGHVALSGRDPARATEILAPTLAFVQEQGIVEPGAARFVPDLIEAHIELTQTHEAARILDWYETNARRVERTSALANCARCRGMLAGQAGRLEDALAAYQEALDWHAKVALPLDHARTLLALGSSQRRVKRRREARETLHEALALFEEMGAALWAERARAELKRISGRASTPGALTPAEERVAALVCEGKTNRQVAAALYLSDRTIEGHLARIFGKLGIRHRTELAGALQARGIDVSNTGDSPVSAETSAP